MTNTGKTAGAVSGRATGVLFFAGFGSLWMFTGLSAMNRLNLVSGSAVLAMAAALIVPALRLLSAASKASPDSQPGADDREMKRAFSLVNAAQWVAILASVVVLNICHKPEYIAPVIAFIVGVHLFPLARVFRYPAHDVTGWLLVLWSGGVVACAPAQAFASVGAVGTAVILLGSAAYALTAASRAAKLGYELSTGRLAA